MCLDLGAFVAWALRWFFVVLFDHRSVNIARLCSSLYSRLGGFELLVDDGLKRREWACPVTCSPLTKKLGVPRAPTFLARAMSAATASLVSFELRSAKFLDVQREFFGIAVDVSLLELLGALEEFVVHFPEFTLLARGDGCLGCERCVLVEGEGGVLENDPNLVFVGVGDLLEGKVEPRAEGA